MAENTKLIAFEDPDHPGNSPKYHTGKSCIEEGCEHPAGTAWSPYWCFEHNVERIHRISAQMDQVVDNFKERALAAAQERNESNHS